MSTRREFIRHSALATAAAAAGLPLTGTGSNVVTEGDLTTLKWDKAPCRYCGTGCGVNVAVKEGRVVEAGPAAQIFANPRTAYTKALMAAAFAPVLGSPDTPEQRGLSP